MRVLAANGFWTTRDFTETAGNRRLLVIGAFRRSGFQFNYVKGHGGVSNRLSKMAGGLVPFFR